MVKKVSNYVSNLTTTAREKKTDKKSKADLRKLKRNNIQLYTLSRINKLDKLALGSFSLQLCGLVHF